MRCVIFLAIVAILWGTQGWADCKSDCEDEYQTDLKSCKMLHDDPDDPDDVGELDVCMDSAENEFQSCISECKE